MDQESTSSPSNDSPKFPKKRNYPKKITSSIEHLKKPFLDSYEKLESITLASKEVGISNTTVTAWKKDPKFLKEFAAAHYRAVAKNNDNLRSSIMQRAINGTPHYVLDRQTGLVKKDANGQPIVAWRDYETALTIFVAKNRLPEEFQDRVQSEIDISIVGSVSAEIGMLVRRAVPEFCPHCKNALNITPKIVQELESVSQRLAKS